LGTVARTSKQVKHPTQQKRKRMQGLNQEKGGAPHRLEKKQIKRPTFCNYCRQFVWGLGRAYSCIVCSYTIHKRCFKGLSAEEIPHTCQLQSVASIFNATLPIMPLNATTLSTSNNTNAQISSSTATSHPTGKIKSTLNSFEEHHWIEGNVRVGSACLVCEEAISSVGFHGLHCSRCHQSVHTDCLPSLSDMCSPSHKQLLWPGYVDPTVTPLIVFVNSRSGGQQGIFLKRKLTRYLGPNQVFDLADGGPGPGLERFKYVPNLRILACGGDGTAAWVLEYVDKAGLNEGTGGPACGVLPLGTGNDLARTLGWGGGYDGEKLSPILTEIERAQIVQLDRWKVRISAPDTGKEIASHVMNNYFSCGVDAHIALQFHELRETMPQLCSTRLANKILYANYGLLSMLQETVISDVTDLNTSLILHVDGKPVELPSSLAGLSIINLPSYMGGCSLWGSPEDDDEDENYENEGDEERNSFVQKYAPPAIDDGLLEVVGLCGTLHMATIQVNLANAVRIAQGRKIRVQWISPEPAFMQVDGEPQQRERCVVDIELHNQARMLKRREPMQATEIEINTEPQENNTENANENENENENENANKNENASDEEEDTFSALSSALTSSPLFSMIPALLSGEHYTELLTPYRDIQDAFTSLFSNGDEESNT
jgi:diacylglycerol kinase family enzyme